MTITTRLRSGLLVAALALGTGLAGTASAATMSCTTSGKGNSGATFSLADSTAAECYTGNDTNQIDAGFTLFGKTGWTLADKNNDATSGDQSVTFGLAPVNGTKSGPWSINGYAGLRDVVITLKAGNGFGAFLLDTASAGSWSSSKDLSHASIYTNGEQPAPIPLPAAAWMLLAGLGGLGAVARRRRA
jgi:hypothetical protein